MNFYIAGTSGVGKSTLARKIASRFDLHYIELDALQFKPHWEKRPDELFEASVLTEMQKGSWVICGNYKNIQALVMEEVDEFVWLDFPFLLIFWRVIKRTVRRITTREKCCGDNYETWYQQLFTRYSIFKWVIGSHPKNRRRYKAFLEDPKHGHRVRRLGSPKALEKYLGKL